MDLSDYFWMFIKSFNPNQYEKLLQHQKRVFFVFLGLVLILCVIIFTLLLIPLTYEYTSSIPAKTAEVEQLDLNADVVADHPVILLNRPEVVLDLDANGTRTGDITLTNEGIIHKKYFLFGQTTILWDDITNLKNQTQAKDRMLTALIIFLLPSIIFWFFVFNILISAALVGILTLIGYLGPRLFKYSISGTATFKLALLTLPSTLIMSAFYPLAPLSWWGLAITVVLFFIGVALISDIAEEQHRDSEHRRQGKV